MFKWMKYTGIGLGTIFCLLYFIFITSKGDNTPFAIILGLPLLAWPIITWKWPNIGAWTIFATGIVTTWFFMIGTLFSKVNDSAILGFILLALIPAGLISGLLFYYWHVEGF